MAYVFITLAHDPTVRLADDDLMRYLGPAAPSLYAAFLRDSIALAERVTQAEVILVARVGSGLIARQMGGDDPQVVLLPDMRPATLAAALAAALAYGPVVILRGDMPHLPIWRLRDAITHLDGGADLVIGPGETGGWYLIGMRAAHPALLRALPGSDDPPDDLCIAAATHGLRVAQLPAWYTLDTLADLERLAADLSTMPPDVAPQTRDLLDGGAQARAVGG
jgi:glycosyltransferase A (GT-A) superfamily protein (DUF2064 family)